jgi:tripartite-type tricarboxylate transporter receptor subunit TctC
MHNALQIDWRLFFPNKLRTASCIFICLIAIGFGSVPLVNAQDYPTRPISLIVPSTPGSAPDVLGRIIAYRLSERLGQQVVVLNRPGAGTNIGVTSIARAAPDGYTLGLASSPITINPHIMPSVGYRLHDLAPISTIASAAEVLVIPPSTKANTVRELIALLKTQPGMPAGHPGIGTTPHLALEMFRRMAGVDVLEVPYKGGGEAQQGILGNQVAFMFSTSIGILPKVRSGTVRALAVSSATRIASAPELPTVAESGVPGFDVVGWYGLFAPTGTPRPIIDRLSAETRAALTLPEVRKLLIDLGADPLGSTPEAFAILVNEEFVRWGKLVKEAGITMN